MKYKQDINSSLLTDHLCNSFEQDYSVKLPDDYKYFLCKTLNGGVLACADDTIQLPDGSCTDIQLFRGVGADGAYNMEEAISGLGKESIPVGMIPIANDSGGNFFFLETIGENIENVYFFNHEAEPNDPPTADSNPSLSLVAHSFNEFLDNIECIEST